MKVFEKSYWSGMGSDGPIQNLVNCPLCGEQPNINDLRFELSSYSARCCSECPNEHLVLGQYDTESAVEEWNEIIEKQWLRISKRNEIQEILKHFSCVSQMEYEGGFLLKYQHEKIMISIQIDLEGNVSYKKETEPEVGKIPADQFMFSRNLRKLFKK